MEKFILSKEYDVNNNLITLKTVNDYKEFKEVLKVFSGYPYYEVLSDKDCKDEYELYLQKGLVIGHYINDTITGINCIVNEYNKDYSIKFSDNDLVAYYSGIAVKPEFRRLGIGKLLVKNTDKLITDLDKYDYEYARILCEGSMSEGIFRQYGFNDAYYSDELIVDEVSYEMSNGEIHQDKRKYMVKTLSNKGSGFTKR